VLTTSTPRATGTLHISRDTGTRTWSEQVHAVYGFAPGEVVLVDRDLPVGSWATWDDLAAELTDDPSEERSG
jgi:hypothetical protein